MNHPVQQSPQHPRAFTLVEMAVALALAGIVGVGILAMTNALGTMTNDKFNARATLVSKQVVHLRLASSIRTATAVLATSQDTIVLWTSDANMNGVPNLSELRLIRYKPSTSEILVYQASTTPAIDTAYTLADDYLTIASNLIAANSLPPTVILKHVAAWNIALDNANAKLARLARVRVTTSTPGGPETSTVIAALKCSRSP